MDRQTDKQTKLTHSRLQEIEGQGHEGSSEPRNQRRPELGVKGGLLAVLLEDVHANELFRLLVLGIS
jgi:hypothetical protein